MLKLCQSRTLFRPFPRVDHAAPFGVFVEVVLGDSAVVWMQMLVGFTFQDCKHL